MKKNKNKSILACAVLASVLGAAAPVWADEGNEPLNISCTNLEGAAYGVVNGLPGALILAGEFKCEPLLVIGTGVTYRQDLAKGAEVFLFDDLNEIKSLNETKIGYSPVIDKQNLGGKIQGGQYPGYSTQNLFVAGFMGSPQMNFIDTVSFGGSTIATGKDPYRVATNTDGSSLMAEPCWLNPVGSTLILDNVGNITVTGKSADSRAVLTMGNGALTYLNFADNDSGITMNITDDMPVSQFNYYVAEGRDNSLTVLKNLDSVTINNTPVPVDKNFWQCLKTTGGAQIVVLDKDNNIVAADAAHWGTESHGEEICHFYTPIVDDDIEKVQSMTALGFDDKNVVALKANKADASATFKPLGGSLRSVNFGDGNAYAVSVKNNKTAKLKKVMDITVNATNGKASVLQGKGGKIVLKNFETANVSAKKAANFISVSGGSNITVNGKDNWATVDVKSEKKDANFVFAKDGTNTVNVNGVDAMLYPGAEGKAYVAHVKAGETTLNLTDSSVSGNLNTVLVGIPVNSAELGTQSDMYVTVNPAGGGESYTTWVEDPLPWDGVADETKMNPAMFSLMVIDPLATGAYVGHIRHTGYAENPQMWAPARQGWQRHITLQSANDAAGPAISETMWAQRRVLTQAANGPTAIYLTTKLAPHLLGPIAVTAYSYMSIVPEINPPELTNPMDGKMVKRGTRIFELKTSEWRERDFINPSDIETIEVLKDAASTAIYGSRGANSVPVYALLPMAYYTPAYVQAEAGATLNLNMENSLLQAGVNSFENHGTVNMNMINSNWVMQDDSNVNSLQMDDKSEVIFDRDSWKYLTLNVDEYQGQGNIILNADLGYSGVTSDKLVIKKALVQNAIGGSGDPVLNLYVLTDDNPLTDPNTKAEVLTLGKDTENLQINLITDNIPDNGLWHYAPEWSKDENNNSTLSFGLKRGDELSTVGRAVTGGVIDTQVWYQESDAVFDRVNNPSVSCCATDSPPDVGHETEEQGSVWASYTHSKNTYDNSIKAITSVANQGGIEKRYNGAVVGYDQCIATYPEHNAALYMGGLIGYGEGRNSWSGGNSELDGKGIGIYAGYKTHKGAYLTALAKYNQYNMDVKGYGYNEVKDDYRLHSFGVSLNAGRRYAKDLNKGFYVEPQAELGYVNYGNDNYELRGIKVEMQETKSCRGRLGLQFGTHNGSADVYGRVSYLKDFQGDSDIMTHYLNGTRDSIKVEQGGHWWNFALGGTFTNGKNLSGDMSVNLDRGDHDSKLGFRVGLNWMF